MTPNWPIITKIAKYTWLIYVVLLPPSSQFPSDCLYCQVSHFRDADQFCISALNEPELTLNCTSRNKQWLPNFLGLWGHRIFFFIGYSVKFQSSLSSYCLCQQKAGVIGSKVSLVCKRVSFSQKQSGCVRLSWRQILPKRFFFPDCFFLLKINIFPYSLAQEHMRRSMSKRHFSHTMHIFQLTVFNQTSR